MIVGMSSCGKDDGSSSVPQRPSGGNQADSIAIAGIQWQEREIQTGIISKTAQVPLLFDYPQTIRIGRCKWNIFQYFDRDQSSFFEM